MSNILKGISKNKTGTIAIALLLMFSMSASMMLIPSVHALSTIPVFAYINAAPNPTGVNQQVEIIMWVQVIFGTNAELTNNYRFTGWDLTVTAPDGSNTSTTLGAVTSPTSDYDYTFTPTTTGTYTLTFNFPATTVTASNDPTSPIIGDTYTAATASTTLTVQSTPISAIPQTPLPTSYWMRPIYGENTAWYALGSNWLGFGSPGYIALGGGPNLGGNGEEFGSTTNVGSLTAHVMWTMPLAPGGVVGQTATTIPGNTYAEGSAYDQKYTNPIIVDGMLIFTEPISQTEPSSGPTVCINLETGQQIWTSTTIPALSFAYVYDAEDPNQHGVWPPMLVASAESPTFTTEWEFYDAFTGSYLFTLDNIPGQGFFGPAANTASMMGPEGEYLMVSLVNYGNSTNPNWYLQEWNSSRIWDDDYSGPSTTPVIPPPIVNGAWAGGYVTEQTEFGPETEYLASLWDYNVSVPWLNTATLNGAHIGSITVPAGIQGDELLAYAGNLPSTGENSFFGAPSDTPYTWYGININATNGTLGAELWSNPLQPPPDNITVLWAGIDPVNNVYVENYRETNQFVGFSLLTGKQIWGPTTPQASLDYYGSDGSGSISDAIAYGNIYSSAYAGIVYCYSTATGDLLWTYGNGGEGNSTNSGVESPFGNYPTFVNAIGNGVVYLVTTEHTEETPIFKGAEVRAINATNGQQIWTLSDYTGEFLTSSYAMADGYNTFFNGYDNQVYVVGRGPSQTIVNAPDIGVTTATPITITGSVLDVSAGTQQTEQKGDFPNGVPVSSDASMTAWMGYVYQQQPEPTNFTGVQVQLAVLDSNGNHYPIGTATTNEYGTYSLTWTPAITGNYTIYATFAGNNGYWPSSADTYVHASAPVPTSAPTASPVTGLATASDLTYGIVAVVIILIIAIAIVGLLILRKHA